jgi:carboxymethylenebutenolidase
MLLFFGDQDAFIPNEEVDKIKTTLARLGKSAEVVVYPGAPHGFFCTARDSYRADAAKDAWTRLMAFFAKHLKS